MGKSRSPIERASPKGLAELLGIGMKSPDIVPIGNDFMVFLGNKDRARVYRKEPEVIKLESYSDGKRYVDYYIRSNGGWIRETGRGHQKNPEYFEARSFYARQFTRLVKKMKHVMCNVQVHKICHQQMLCI